MPPINGQMLAYQGADGPVQAYLARPAAGSPRPAVIVIHEIFGLTDHTKDVANRFADQGYVALAPHLFSRPGLEDFTPENIREAMTFSFSLQRERMSDPAYLQEAMSTLPAEKRAVVQNISSQLFSGGMPRDRMVMDLSKAVDFLAGQKDVLPGKIASVGFCFGGGMSISLACQTPLAACVVFYGNNPSPIDLVANIAGPVLGIYGAEDSRINQDLDQLVKAMAVHKKDFEMRIYPGAAHAFFNDTSPTTYREGPAKQAWEQVLRFYQRTLLEA